MCKKQLPAISEANGLYLDEIPEELKILDELEKQLIAVSLNFMIIKQLPTRRCRAMVNRVIHVPLDKKDVYNTVNSLPRLREDAAVVPVT